MTLESELRRGQDVAASSHKQLSQLEEEVKNLRKVGHLHLSIFDDVVLCESSCCQSTFVADPCYGVSRIGYVCSASSCGSGKQVDLR